MDCKVEDVAKNLYGNASVPQPVMNLLSELVSLGDKYSKIKVEYTDTTTAASVENILPKNIKELDVKEKLDLIQKAIKARKNIHSKTKEYEKSKIANKFIGQGKEGSSTGDYEVMYSQAGLANTGSYTKDDVVFVSINGNRKGAIKAIDDKGNLTKEYADIDKAIASGSSIIMDTQQHSEGRYNAEGEGRLFDYMSKQDGYRYSAVHETEWVLTNAKGFKTIYGYGKWEKGPETKFEAMERLSANLKFEMKFKETLEENEGKKTTKNDSTANNTIQSGSLIKYGKGWYFVRKVVKGKVHATSMYGKNLTQNHPTTKDKRITKVIQLDSAEIGGVTYYVDKGHMVKGKKVFNFLTVKGKYNGKAEYKKNILCKV